MANPLLTAGLTLADLLPHRPPAVLIDEVLAVDNELAITRSLVKSLWPLADDDTVDPLILVEVAAQTAGVCNGWKQIMSEGRGTEIKGYLVGIKRAQFHADRLAVGREIVTRVRNTHGFEGLREVDCTIHDGGKLLAEITLQLFQA